MYLILVKLLHIDSPESKSRVDAFIESYANSELAAQLQQNMQITSVPEAQEKRKLYARGPLAQMELLWKRSNTDYIREPLKYEK